MKIAVLGASGNVGRLVVAELLQRGYEVRVLVHTNNPFRDPLSKITVVMGDIGDRSAITEITSGCDAVISTLGSWGTPSKDILTRGMRTVIPVLEMSGPKRLITLTGSGALYTADHPSWLDKGLHMLGKLIAGQVLFDGEEHLRLLAASNLDWTCLRSPVMTPWGSAGYRLAHELPSPLQTIPRRAVALALVDQIADQYFSQQAPVIYRR